MSVDDMLWWLYETYKIVVGTRTIRRVFERKGDKVKGPRIKSKAQRANEEEDNDDDGEGDEQIASPPQGRQTVVQYNSPYAPMATAQSAEQHLSQTFHQQQQTPQTPYSALSYADNDLPEDEETIQLQLQQIALQKREVELKLKMRKLQAAKGTPAARKTSTPQSAPSTLFDPKASIKSSGPKRDSRSKKKIEESKKRTAERQERMLRDLERRSRRRDHLTAEWVESKDIWPLRAQSLLADLMHQYSCYAFAQSQEQTFNRMYRDLYQLVDLTKGDWDAQRHDELLRERMKRKMGQLRTKMQKTGEIVSRSDAHGGGWQRAEDYTGETAGEAIGDESELPDTMQQASSGAQQISESHSHQHQHHQQQHSHAHQQMQYEPVPDHQGMAQSMPYVMQSHYQMMPQGQANMMQYNMDMG
jgi:hypothetical protein